VSAPASTRRRRRGARAAGGASRALVASAASLLALCALGGCSTAVLHGLDEAAANDTAAALERAGVAAEKVADDASAGGPAAFTVRVRHAEAPRALELLRALGLPRGRRHGFAEVYGQGSLIPTASEERARYLDALDGEIERTLETVDGVVGARVHLVLEESDPLALEPAPRRAARASVLLKARAGKPSLGEAEVQRLVAGAAPGLEPAAVAVVITTAAEPADGAEARLASLGPVRVTAATRPVLVAGIALALAALAGLALLLLATARRLAALQGRSSPTRDR